MPRARNKLQSATRLKLQQIVRLAALEKTTAEIAQMLGMTEGNVNDLQSHRDYKALESDFVTTMYEPLDEMIKTRAAGRILESAAPDATEVLIGLLYDEDPGERRRASTAILDRSGFGPIQRKAIHKRVELDPVSAQLIGAAIRESNVEAIDAEIVESD